MLLTNRHCDSLRAEVKNTRLVVTYYCAGKPLLDMNVFGKGLRLPTSGHVGTVLQKISNNRDWEIMELKHNTVNGRITSKKIVLREKTTKTIILLKWRGEESMREFLKSIIFTFNIENSPIVREALRRF